MKEQMYVSIADWWPVISPPSEYAEEEALYVEMIHAPARRPVREVLELGSGGGNNASHMKHSFAMTLVEPADGMREISRKLNPECTHLPGDMRSVRLGCTFEAVFVLLLREPDGRVRVVDDVHREGLFPRATWLRLFDEVGLAAEIAPRTIEGQEYDSFVAVRTAT